MRFGLVWFYGVSIIIVSIIIGYLGYLRPNSLYTYILNIWDLVWFGFMEYQSLYVI